MTEDEQKSALIALTAEIVSAHAANNSVTTADVAALIGSVYTTLSGLGAASALAEPEKPTGAVTARKSLSNSRHIISMIDGKPYKTLKRHIGTHGHTPASYREAFGLPHDYPMVAADYGAKRREIAKKIGLGRKPKAPAAVPAKAPAKAAAAPVKVRAASAPKQEVTTPVAAATVTAPVEAAARPPVASEAATAPKPAAVAPAGASPTPRRKLKTVFGNAIAAAKQHLGGDSEG